MGLFSWFYKKPTRPEDYEGVLARLATEINDAKVHLSEVRLRERRYLLLLNLYGIGLWGLWVGVWWLNGIPGALGTGGVVAGPFLIILLNQLVRLVFRRIRTSEETNLRLLLAKQRKQVDEIKKATNFDSTRKLLEQYDAMNLPQEQQMRQQGQRGPQKGQRGAQQGQHGQPGPGGPGGQPPSPSTPRRPGANPASPDSPARAPGTPGQMPHTPSPVSPYGSEFEVERALRKASPSTPVPLPPGMTQEQAALFAMQLQSIQPILPTPEKKWYDRLADSILGDDPVQASNNKYALVCGECFRHNGLVGNKHEWERMQWICPRCDHLNPAPLSRMKMEMDEPETPIKPRVASGLPQQASPLAQPAIQVPAPAPVSAPHLRSPAPRRRADRGAPRQSRLGTEVFSAADHEDGDEEDEDMEVDQ